MAIEDTMSTPHHLSRFLHFAPKLVGLGEEYKVQADVDALNSFSGHVDHSEMIDYFNATGGKKEKV